METTQPLLHPERRGKKVPNTTLCLDLGQATMRTAKERERRAVWLPLLERSRPVKLRRWLTSWIILRTALKAPVQKTIWILTPQPPIHYLDQDPDPSGEKSISSEGISIGGSTTLAARVVIDQAENVIGDDASGARVSFKDATATAIVIEFLEPTGTRISVVEAKGLENLLRSALMYLPEERMPPSELAKHHWFFDDFKG
jgi:hypothetical protein